MKLLYISKYNKQLEYKRYLYDIIKNIYILYNFYLKKKYSINKIYKLLIFKKKSFKFQYEDRELIKYILFLTLKYNIKFNIFKNNNINFFLNLYKKTKKKNNKILNIIKEKIINWDIKRINKIELIILKMAITEFFFLNISYKSINIIITEYINIIKIYSSYKSKIFINGILDNIFKTVKI
ncbi:MAG: hypothetical protein NHG14_00475 [Candidatus Shikimatogenerans bostrichidophilus]|nr:MAG: hypothetical protein NHG14_00475 [Candidatus Shikimatogenerans bostrichidophilus]